MHTLLTDRPAASSDSAGAVSRLARALLRYAPPGHPDAGFFSTVLAKSLVHEDLGRSGLSPRELDGLLAHLFPNALVSRDLALATLLEQGAAYATPSMNGEHGTFMRLLRALLDAWRTPGLDTTPWVTSVLTSACLRPDHLWRDLGLSDREDVTALLARHYPGLVARNVNNLRWKKFLAYAACEHAGLPPAQAPGCPDCEDYGACYPPAAA